MGRRGRCEKDPYDQLEVSFQRAPAFSIIIMRVGIISNCDGERAQNALSLKMEELISKSEVFLFTIVDDGSGLGEWWARENGLPYYYEEGNLEKLLRDIDYGVFVIEGQGQGIKNLLMKFKIKYPEKHGSVIKI